jgi:putative chitobiose transport system substrate-binding protein
VTLKRILSLGLASAMLVAACGPSASPSASSPAASAGGSSAPSSNEPSASSSAAAAPLPVDTKEAVIPNVEPNAEISFWTYYLSPTFDDYIKATIARFEQTYPGVKVKWEDHQAQFKEELNNQFNAGTAPDVINLSVSEGWVSEYAGKGLLLPLTSVPQEVKDIYFPGLWGQQLIDDVNYQFPWYQGIAVELINKAIYEDGAGLKVAEFPKTIQELPAVCKTIFDKTGKVCDIRLTVTDLLAQMTYENDVEVINEAGDTFTFDSPAGVEWLQMYVDMVKAGTVDTEALTTPLDRVGLLLFSSGAAPFYQTGAGLVRDVKQNNPTLYDNMGMVQAPVGKSGVSGKGLMSISVNAKTKFPNASMALAQYFTNPRAMVEFAKLVPVYPSSPSAYEDPFFTTPTTAIEDSVRPLAKDIVATLADIVPTVPKKAEVNEIVKKAVEQAIFNDVPAQKALSDAVVAANALIK